MNNQETEFCVLGMTCTGCAQRVTKVLERVDGVRSADVSLNDKLAKVSYDADTANFEDMKLAIERAGYTVERTWKRYASRVKSKLDFVHFRQDDGSMPNGQSRAKS